MGEKKELKIKYLGFLLPVLAPLACHSPHCLQSKTKLAYSWVTKDRAEAWNNLIHQHSAELFTDKQHYIVTEGTRLVNGVKS